MAEIPFAAHYSAGPSHFYISEVDQATGEAFGYADFGFGTGGFGSVMLPELEELKVQAYGTEEIALRDMGYVPGTRASEVIDRYSAGR